MKSKLLIIGMLLICCGLFLMTALVSAQDDEATEEPPDTPTSVETDETPDNLEILDDDIEIAIEPTGNNGYCTICHDQPLRTTRLADGSILNLYVNPEMIIGSVHGPSDESPGLGCLDCHENSFPHNGPPPVGAREYTLEMVSLCTSCHVVQGEDLVMGLHAQAISDGNLEAAVCTDCHGAHHIQSAESFPQLVAGVCGDCHETTFDEWQISEHADIGPLGCGACHDYHAQTLRVGDTPDALCMNCHADNLPELHVHDTHIGVENEVGCVECHMFTGHDGDDAQLIASVDMTSTGHSMLLDTVPCTTCHEQLTASGEWDQILAARFDAELVVEDEAATEEADEHGEEDDDDGDSLAIFQGLLAGLGLGVTFAVVFITRSAREPEAATVAHDDDEEASH